MQKRDKKQQILEAGKDVLLKKGIFKTRVEDVTNYLGIAKGSFYTYFKSKDQLLEEIIIQFFDIRKNEFEEIEKSTEDFRDKIKKFIIRRFAITTSENLKSHLILINLTRNLEHLSSELRTKLIEIELLNRKILREILTQAIVKNLKIGYSKKELEVLIIFIMGGIKSYRLDRLFYKNKEDYFISDIKDLQERMQNIDLENEIELLTNGIIKILTGGK
ncbi:TetR/AcrR family transcriptional regulator [Cetobacterium sp. 8H]|uniref:TetR/AcrR family transcriptional regulator n=1 Tax=Cetobacterium sp. 8H TaxID=2759681 RepID=UPI00163C4A5F|nr:TetR/AcrR family transcriptional regulator [Cetobacterium sp. 8H]MBC2850660.1 TetR/AcrR family transcriptional regulator [Cetobacterium sp. 8H]